MYTPWTSRTIGIEMEVGSTNTLSRTMSEFALKAAVRSAVGASAMNGRPAGYWHSDGTTWDVKTDSSCGWEVASPALRIDATGHNTALRAVCTQLQDINASTPNATGLHVHIDASNLNWQGMQRLITLWSRYEPLWYEMIPTQRRGNTYCQPMHRNTWAGEPSRWWLAFEHAMKADTQPRFERWAKQNERRLALNLTGWWRHGRVEIRLHHGTLDYDVIRQWAMLMTSLVERASNAEARFPHVKPITGWNGANGFATRYVMTVLGLTKSKSVPDVSDVALEVARFADTQRLHFTPLARRARQGCVLTPEQRRRGLWQNIVDAQRAREARVVARAEPPASDTIVLTPATTPGIVERIRTLHEQTVRDRSVLAGVSAEPDDVMLEVERNRAARAATAARMEATPRTLTDPPVGGMVDSTEVLARAVDAALRQGR